MRARIAQQLFWSIAGGVALTCAFDGIGLGFLAWPALALILFALRDVTGRQAFGLGFVAGFVHFVTLLYWLVPTMHYYGPLPVWMSIGILVLLALYLAVYVALFSAVIVSVRPRPGWLILTVPVVWVSFEYLRSFLFSGFPWGLIGYSQYRYLYLIQVADLTGVYGISFLLCLASAAVLLALLYLVRAPWQGRPVTGRVAGAALLAVAVITAGVIGYGKWRVSEIDRMAAAAETATVSVVQGNIAQSLKWDETFTRETTAQYIRLSETIAQLNPDLVVWPETAMPFYFYHDRELTEQVLAAIDRMNTYFLIGSPSFEYDPLIDQLWLYNTAYLVDPDGLPIGKYDKVHLVPFGEYVPLQKWLPFVEKMVPQVGDFRAGRPGHLVSMPDADIGIQICYEIIFPELSAGMVRNGGDLIVNITNDAWFGRTAAPWQHFSMSLFRAVENRRALVRAANTGISAYVDPAGRVREQTRLFEAAVMTRDVPVLKAERTFYTEHGNLLPAGCLAGLLLLITGSTVNRFRKRMRQ